MGLVDLNEPVAPIPLVWMIEFGLLSVSRFQALDAVFGQDLVFCQLKPF
jgi:hypothetical protein